MSDTNKSFIKCVSIFINILLYGMCAIYLIDAILQKDLTKIITILCVLILWTIVMLVVAHKVKNEENEEETSNICDEEFNKDTFITTYAINDFDNFAENNNKKDDVEKPLL